MSDRRDYFYLQTVTEAELDDGFNGLEQADFNFVVDTGFYGLMQNGDVSERSTTPDLTVEVGGPAVAYSKQGERIATTGTQVVDVSVDDNAASTAVGTPGNEKWVSVFLEFDRALSDPRTDGLSATVYFIRNESYKFSVVQGAEAAIGVATKPAIDPNKILLADINRVNGQTQIFNADINTDRREDVIRITGGTLSLIAGTFKEGLSAMLTNLNNHVDGVAGVHPATAVSNTPAGNIAATTVQAAINELDTEKPDTSLVALLAATLNAFTGRASFGSAFIGTDANAELARIFLSAASTATSSYTNLLEADGPNGLPLRMYYDPNGVRFTCNALWDESVGIGSWLPDDTSSASWMVIFNQTGITTLSKDAISPSTSFTNGDWDRTNILDVGASLPGLTLTPGAGTELTMSDGIIDFGTGSGTGTNRSSPLYKNVLCAKNTVKAWARATSLTNLQDEYGVVSVASDAGSPAARVFTFDYSATTAGNQAFLATGATYTGQGVFQTVSAFNANTVTIDSWRWNGSAIVQIDGGASGDCFLARMATID